MPCWTAVIHLKSSDLVIGDYKEGEIKDKHINVKEIWNPFHWYSPMKGAGMLVENFELNF